jgi:hypothetical protein
MGEWKDTAEVKRILGLGCRPEIGEYPVVQSEKLKNGKANLNNEKLQNSPGL